MLLRNVVVLMVKDVVERQIGVLFHRCYRMLQDKEQAWDALQEVVTRFIEKSQKQTIEKPEHYLFRICTYHCIDLLRQREHGLRIPIGESCVSESILLSKTTEHSIEGKLLIEDIIREFGKEAILLLFYRHVDRMTYRELGELMQLTPQGAKYKIDTLEQAVLTFLQS